MLRWQGAYSGKIYPAVSILPGCRCGNLMARLYMTRAVEILPRGITRTTAFVDDIQQLTMATGQRVEDQATDAAIKLARGVAGFGLRLAGKSTVPATPLGLAKRIAGNI